jgi:hypothetical protein
VNSRTQVRAVRHFKDEVVDINGTKAVQCITCLKRICG